MDLGLLQREVAERIGVAKDTYRFWECNATRPLPRQWPALVRFLGRLPLAVERDLASQLRAARLSRGLTQRELAMVLDVDPATLSRWERGMLNPGKRMVKKSRKWAGSVLRDGPREPPESPSS